MKKGVGKVPTGKHVKVSPHSKVALEFNEVSKEGTASVLPVSTYPPLAHGKFLGEVFDIQTTAVFLGTVRVGLSFDGTGLTDEQKKKLRVYRNDLKKNSVWEDVTSSIDTANNVAFGVTDHFSVFGVH